MAKSKTKKTKERPVDDDEPQVKSRDGSAEDDGFVMDDEAEATEIDADEPQVKQDDDDDAVADSDDDARRGDDDDEAKADDDDEAEAEADDDEDEDDDDDDSIDEPPPDPPAGISKLTLVLILLNWIAAPTFLWFAYMDHFVRIKHGYRTMLNYAQIYGLPLKSEDKNPSFATETRSLIVLTPEQLKEQFRARATGKSVKEEFASYEETIERRIPYRLKPSDLKAGEGEKPFYAVLFDDSASKKKILEDIFQGQPDPVATLEEEIERLLAKAEGDDTRLEADIKAQAKSARDALAKETDAKKRDFVKNAGFTFSYDSLRTKNLEAQLADPDVKKLDVLFKKAVIRRTLFTITANSRLIRRPASELAKKPDPDKKPTIEEDDLEERLEKAKTDSELDALLDDALQRRMYYDFLAPLSVFRPGESRDVNLYDVENVADTKKFPLKAVREIVRKRLAGAIAANYDPDVHFGKQWTEEQPSPDAMKRDSLEKRRTIGFILFALGQINVPTLGTKLYPAGVERAQIISGLFEFTNANIYYVRAQRIMQERMIQAIVAHRDGQVIEKEGQPTVRTPNVATEYGAEVERLVKLYHQVQEAEKQLVELKRINAHDDAVYKLRLGQHKNTADRLVATRKATEDLVKKLRVKQDELYEKYIELSNAGERNFRLYQEIEQIERRFIAEQERLNSIPKKGKKK